MIANRASEWADPCSGMSWSVPYPGGMPRCFDFRTSTFHAKLLRGSQADFLSPTPAEQFTRRRATFLAYAPPGAVATPPDAIWCRALGLTILRPPRP